MAAHPDDWTATKYEFGGEDGSFGIFDLYGIWDVPAMPGVLLVYYLSGGREVLGLFDVNEFDNRQCASRKVNQSDVTELIIDTRFKCMTVVGYYVITASLSNQIIVYQLSHCLTRLFLHQLANVSDIISMMPFPMEDSTDTKILIACRGVNNRSTCYIIDVLTWKEPAVFEIPCAALKLCHTNGCYYVISDDKKVYSFHFTSGLPVSDWSEITPPYPSPDDLTCDNASNVFFWWHSKGILRVSYSPPQGSQWVLRSAPPYDRIESQTVNAAGHLFVARRGSVIRYIKQ